jgi:hypothetical protein
MLIRLCKHPAADELASLDGRRLVVPTFVRTAPVQGGAL